MAITVFLSRSPGLLNQGPWGPASLGHVPHSSIFSPTDWTSCAPSYIIIWCPLFFLRASQFCTQFNPSMVKVISWYSSTGCPCYLCRCISYFESLAGVNMLQFGGVGKYIYIYIYISTTPLSCRNNDHQSMLIPLTQLPSITICYHLVIPLECIHCWHRTEEYKVFANTGMSMCWSPLENVTYDFILTSPAMPNLSCSSHLYGLWDGK